MSRKIPRDAFTFYFSLGPERSYQAVADEYDVTKQAVCKLAQREKWQERIEKLEAKARERTDQKIAETLEEMDLRHLKEIKLVRARAIEALSSASLTSPMDAVKALNLTWRQERLIRGEPTERNAVSVEEAVKREYQRWMTAPEDDENVEGEGEIETDDEDGDDE